MVTFLCIGVWSNWHEWGKCQFVTVPWIGSFYFFGFSINLKLQMVKYKCSFMIQRQCIGRKYRSRDCLDRNHFNYSKIEYICQEGEPVDGTDFLKPIILNINGQVKK